MNEKKKKNGSESVYKLKFFTLLICNFLIMYETYMYVYVRFIYIKLLFCFIYTNQTPGKLYQLYHHIC